MHNFALAALAALATLLAPLPRGNTTYTYTLDLGDYVVNDGDTVAVLVPSYPGPTDSLVAVELGVTIREQFDWGAEVKRESPPLNYRHFDRFHLFFSEVRARGGDQMGGAGFQFTRVFSQVLTFDGNTTDCAGTGGVSGTGSGATSSIQWIPPSLTTFPESFWVDDTSDEVATGVTILNPLGLSSGVAIIIDVEMYVEQYELTGMSPPIDASDDMGLCAEPEDGELVQLKIRYTEGAS